MTLLCGSTARASPRQGALLIQADLAGLVDQRPFVRSLNVPCSSALIRPWPTISSPRWRNASASPGQSSSTAESAGRRRQAEVVGHVPRRQAPAGLPHRATWFSASARPYLGAIGTLPSPNENASRFRAA